MGSVFSDTTMQFFKRRSVRVLGAVAVVLGVAAGAAMALIPDGNGVINACYHNRTGVLRVVDTAGDCNTQEVALSWKADALSNAVAGGDLTGSYPNPEIAANAVGSPEIADNAVGSSEIASDAVGSSEIADGSVTSADLAAGAVQLGENSVTERELAETNLWKKQLELLRTPLGTVLTSTLKLKDDSVSSTTLQDNSITSSKLQLSSVLGSNLANGAVTSTKIADNAVTDEQIADEAVTTEKIADNAVTGAQINFVRVQGVYNNDVADSVDAKGATATCPPGKVASGGGFQLLGNPDAWRFVSVIQNQPLTPPGTPATNWSVYATEIGDGTALNWGILAFAVCT